MIYDDVAEDLGIEPESDLEKTQPLPEVDWTLLDHPRVEAALHRVANAVARKHAEVTSADDMHQEGAILVAAEAEVVRRYLEDNLLGDRALHRWLLSRLIDVVRTDAARSSRSVPLSVLEVDAASER